MSSPEQITTREFSDALARYPALIKALSTPPKENSLSLVDLDYFRYVEAPSSASVKGSHIGVEELKKLVEWKLRHGAFRPSLPKLVASNTDEKVKEITKDAFKLYDENSEDTAEVITKLSELRGIGPATASLILAIHDPHSVVFFSDELFRWLFPDNSKPKYTPKEFDTLFAKSKPLLSRLGVKAVDLEKVAYVLIKESEPKPEPKAVKVPSGPPRPRGRPPKPESEKKVKPVATGPSRGRGRPPKAGKVQKAPAAAKKAAKEDVDSSPQTPKAEEGVKRKRGRPAGLAAAGATSASKKSSANKGQDADLEEEDTPGRKSKRSKV
ncbi:hypothetical protein PVAG01_04372 [Phlyctema vagabunda]|uniref:Uncharacterized protein n=1 Tax=Phlyctema vagabunda TaxID=108571 RepID=A0ABR4PQB2_9HELO